MSRAPSPFANVRTMSLSAAEYAASIEKLGAHSLSAAGNPVFAFAGGSVEVRYEAAPAKTLGGLLALPQARVTLEFSGGSAESRADFVHRFDVAFQRGGG